MKNSLLVLILVLVLTVCCSCGLFHKHAFSDSYSYDDTNHWHECECGEKADVTEHSWNKGVVTLKPTAESEGERTYFCNICRGKKIEKIDKLDPGHTHSYDKLNNDENYHWYECECGEINSKLTHAFDSGVITQHPTTESEGVKTYTCSVCNYEKTEKLDKLDPDHTTHEYSISASDEESHWLECVCGERKDVTAHAFDGGVETIPAGENRIGIKTFTCSDCGRKVSENIPAQLANGLSFLQSTHYRITNKLAKTPLTVEAEIQVSPSVSGRAGAIFGNYYGIRQDWLLEIYDNGMPRFYFSDAAGNVKDYRFDQVDVRSNDFVHIALVVDYENRGVHFYLDGVLEQTVAMDVDLAADITRYQFVVGGDNRSNNGIYFKGQIRSVSAYSDIRTADEIARSAECGTNLYADDLLLSFLLNKDCAGNDIEDLTGNGYDIPKEWLDSHKPTLDYAYSFAVVGDTQWLSKYQNGKMAGIYEWILDNKDDKKIAHVFGLGDITEDWNTAGKEAEWIKAQEHIYKLNGIIPYSLVRGNHDESKYFNKYFATEEYMSQFDGFYMVEGDIRNSYKLFTIGSTDYLFMTLDFGASDEMLAWANEVVLAHPNHRVIVTTHGYQGFDGNHLSYDNTPSSGGMAAANDVDTSVGNNNRGYNNGQQIFEKFVSLHPNIFLVMSGHTPDEDVVVLESKGVHGNTVTQMLIDAQWMDPQKDGTGMVCMLYFSEDGRQMEVEWICTDTGKYYKEMNQFTQDISGSFDVPAHDFKNAFDENNHHKTCECGYIIDEQPHTFDGGVLNSDGFMVYSCECGYQRVASATDDPIAKELQALLEEYYNNGTYFVGSYFFGGDKFWTDDAEDYKLTADYLTLYDLIMGRYGDLRFDLGWNKYEGVYSSSNESTVKGLAMLTQMAKADEVNVSGLTKVSIEADGAQLIIKLCTGDSVSSTTAVGLYATTTYVTHAGDIVDVIYTKVGADHLCEIIAPTLAGYVAEYDRIIIDSRHSSLTITVYYSTVSIWDGVSVSTSLKGSGTEEDPFLIESGADLAYLRDVVISAAAKTPNFSGKYFKMIQSIDLDGIDLFIGSYPGWADRRGFYGFFDGNHCTIRGLDNTSSLFGTIEGGWLKDLSVYGKVNGGATVGGIVGYVANGGRLENLTSYVTVKGNNTLGGVVGNAENQASTVINCTNYGSVTGSSYILGGIAGSGGHDFINCVNFGDVTSTGNDVVGGIIGSTKNTGTISNCYNYGKINARGKVGGIIGLANKPVKNCVNYGDINGTWALGGIVGYVKQEDNASISDCVNFGNITATSTGIGGIFGILEGGAASAGRVTVTGCVNNGNVSGTWGIGGIVGDAPGSIIDCINNGTISAKGDLGGIIGKAYGEITGCVNNGEIIGAQTIIGGIVGRLHVATHYVAIMTTNRQNGSVTGPDAQQIIGKTEGTVEELITLNENVIGINHRGWYKAPENTLSAYRESAKQGFKYVECDVLFTKDGVPVLLHDDTIDRTSNGSGAVSSFTYEQLLQYDFSYDDNDKDNDFSAYRGEKIPTFAEFIALCKELELHAYVEIKGSITAAQADQLVKIVSDAGMLDDVSWLSFSGDALAKIVDIDTGARVVWVMTDTNAAKIEANNLPFAKENLMTGENVVVFDLWHSLAKQDVCDLLKTNGILLEVWTMNDASAILKLNPYVTGVTSDMYDASQLANSAK